MGREAKIDEIFKSTDDTGKEQVDEVAVEYRYDEKGTWRNLRLAKPLSIAAQVSETLIVPVHETAVHPIKNYLNQIINGTRPKKQPNKLQNQTNWSPEMLFARLDIQNEPVGAKLDIPSTGTSCPEKPEPANYEEELRNLVMHSWQGPVYSLTSNGGSKLIGWPKLIWGDLAHCQTIKKIIDSSDNFSYYYTVHYHEATRNCRRDVTIRIYKRGKFDPGFDGRGFSFENIHDAGVFIRFLNALMTKFTKNMEFDKNEFYSCEWENNKLRVVNPSGW